MSAIVPRLRTVLFAGEQPGDDGPLDAEAACDLGLGHLLGLAYVLQLLEELGSGNELREVALKGRALLIGCVGLAEEVSKDGALRRYNAWRTQSRRLATVFERCPRTLAASRPLRGRQG